MKNKNITSRDVDFGEWYQNVVESARLATYSNVKGCIVFEPNGYAIWESMQNVLDKMFKETNHQNVYMPLLIPESLMKKEADLIEGFAPEAAWVTKGGDKELEEPLCIRPTSETLFSDYFSSVLSSYRDLPMKYNQWCNVLRWEKETKPFLRSREFLWQEGHTVHETKEEAEKETRGMLEVYRKFYEEYLAIPVEVGRKTESEKFAGAEYTLTVEALMYNGVSLQGGTSHYFGQKFAKAYDIKYLSRENKLEYVYQTSWGVSTRMIGGLIMVHGDDNGLVLPPKIAPNKVILIPIGSSEEVILVTNEIKEKLLKNNISVIVDETDKQPGFKFASAEVLGIPIRIEIGERDLKDGKITLVRRDTREKITEYRACDIVSVITHLLDNIQSSMYNKAKIRKNELTFDANTINDVKDIMNKTKGFIKSPWCENPDCEVKMKEYGGLKSRCVLEGVDTDDKKCVVCGKKAKSIVLWGIQY